MSVLEKFLSFFRNIFNERSISVNCIIISLTFLFIIFDNLTFFKNVLNVYPPTQENLAFLFSILVVFSCFLIILFSILFQKYIIKPIIITILIVSSFIAYFMDSYNVFIDDTMIQNAVNSNMAESTELFSLKMMLYFIFLGLIPSIIVLKIKIKKRGFVKESFSRIKLFTISLIIMVIVMIIFGKNYASFFRNHKPLRYYTNPSYYIYSLGSYMNGFVFTREPEMKKIGTDAKVVKTDVLRKLVILVVGETARADRFSLNGYKRETNPLLSKENIINYTNFWACGTTTSISVPCMFSYFKSKEYNQKKVKYTENFLDVLKHAGVNVLWLENNTGSRGVADRVEEKAYQKPENNPVCDIECRDEGMILNLSRYIDSHKTGDFFIVMHQMGNHGPAYYKRYPKRFEKFKPVCMTNQLEQCSKDEIDNAYDNAILYTDYFLSRVIAFLKNNYKNFRSSMIYVSDHGESLGEKGLYLHGIPNFMAPDVQRHVPFILWFSDNFDVNREALQTVSAKEFSHDYLFHSVLGIMGIHTSFYERDLDLFYGNLDMHNKNTVYN